MLPISSFTLDQRYIEGINVKKGRHTISPPRASWRNIRAKILVVSSSWSRTSEVKIFRRAREGSSRGRGERVGERENNDMNEHDEKGTYWRLMIAGLFGKSIIPLTNNS